MMNQLISLAGIYREFNIGSSTLKILKGIDLTIRKGDFVAVMGSSGSGKSTLMYTLGCLERPTSGSYLFNGMNIINASDNELSHVRANYIGFIFQTFNLSPGLNVYENIEVPFLYRNFDKSRIKDRIMFSIGQVGLMERIGHKPNELSGGEMQRVAIARAVCADPLLVLADEPTGNLDPETGANILKIFKKLHSNGSTIIMVTHDMEVAKVADRIVYLKDGRLIDGTKAA